MTAPNYPTCPGCDCIDGCSKVKDKACMTTDNTQAMPIFGMRNGVYIGSTPKLSVGNSAFEDWYQAHEKACTGDKQLARDAYAAGMGDPLVTYAIPQPVIAHSKPESVPSGWVLALLEPTNAMRVAGRQTIKGAADESEGEQAVLAYKRMLAVGALQPQPVIAKQGGAA